MSVYGPHQNPHGEAGVVAIFCERLLKNQQLVINGDGKQTRDFVYVQDIVKANNIALNPRCSGLFNVGTGKETSVNSLTRCLIKASAISTSIEHGPAKEGEQERSSIDNGKLLKGFGWKPSVSLEEGLLETFKYFKNKKT